MRQELFLAMSATEYYRLIYFSDRVWQVSVQIFSEKMLLILNSVMFQSWLKILKRNQNFSRFGKNRRFYLPKSFCFTVSWMLYCHNSCFGKIWIKSSRKYSTSYCRLYKTLYSVLFYLDRKFLTVAAVKRLECSFLSAGSRDWSVNSINFKAMIWNIHSNNSFEMDLLCVIFVDLFSLCFFQFGNHTTPNDRS